MAFSDETYLTTKALYTQIRADEKNVDESFQIGITAKNWGKDEKLWFAAPVKQIVIIENYPVIFGDKVLLVNPPQSLDGQQTYQILSLKTGEEIYRGQTDGKYTLTGKNYLIEQSGAAVSRIDLSQNKPLWKIENKQTKGTRISAIGNQITIATPDQNGARSVHLIDADSGKELKKFNLPNLQNTLLDACYLMKDETIALHFLKDKPTDQNYDYFVGWSTDSNKALWRTRLEDNLSLTSLFSLIPDKMMVISGN
jgi:hypothetical protein